MTKSHSSWAGLFRAASTLAFCAALAACQTLPHDGPSSQSIGRQARSGSYALVELTPAVAQTIAANPPSPLAGLAGGASTTPVDLIAAGDQVSVSVFEPGAFGLFTNSVAEAAQSQPSTSIAEAAMTMHGGAIGAGSAHTLPALLVNSDGDLELPYVGKVHVAGLRSDAAAEVIRSRLRGHAVDPQVTVTVVSSQANSVSVLGEVRAPGRFQLAAHNNRLLDLLSQAGGPTKPAPDLKLAIQRGGQRVEAPLTLVLNDPGQDIRLAPEDQVLVLDQPRTYSTFGALIKDEVTDMGDYRVTLADAISKEGGLDTFSANGAYVLLFRFERPEVARALGVTLPPAAQGVPIVYKVNFRTPEGLFAANSVEIEPSDMLFIPRADIFEAKKFFDLVNSVTQIGYNARITTSKAVP
jgi:polysaccharide biosynthesis/export protein